MRRNAYTSNDKVPKIISACVSYLVAFGLQTVGVFRVPGNQGFVWFVIFLFLGLLFVVCCVLCVVVLWFVVCCSFFGIVLFVFLCVV